MYTDFKKKIIIITDKLTNLVKENLVQLIIIVSFIVFFELIKSFPYINLIPNFQYLAMGFMIFLTLVLFRVSIPNRSVVRVVILLFSLGAVVTIFEGTQIADFIGFVTFVLLTLIVIRSIASDREKLKEVEFD